MNGTEFGMGFFKVLNILSALMSLSLIFIFDFYVDLARCLFFIPELLEFESLVHSNACAHFMIPFIHTYKY
jgi:hypothetical protein